MFEWRSNQLMLRIQATIKKEIWLCGFYTIINKVFPFKHDKRDLKAINYFYCTEQLLISGNIFKQFI